ncbi:MAG: DNA repair protein RecO [bacterium]|nr:DNA repair protein RecO [bacterium]
MNSYYITGIILSRENIGEKDRLVVFLTRERGKLRAVARSSRKISSKMAGSLEPFNLVRCWIHIGKTFDIIKGVELIKTFPNLIKDIKRYLLVSRIVEFIQYVVQENDENPEIFKLLLGTMSAMNDYGNINSIYVFFWVNALALVGYKMRLDRCLCGKREVTVFSSSMGGVLCDDCADKADDVISISGHVLTLLKEYGNIKLSEAIKREIPQYLFGEVENIIINFRIYHTNIRLKSEEVNV